MVSPGLRCSLDGPSFFAVGLLSAQTEIFQFFKCFFHLKLKKLGELHVLSGMKYSHARLARVVFYLRANTGQVAACDGAVVMRAIPQKFPRP